MANAYKQAGVDIEAGYEAVNRMKKHVKRTFRPEVMNGLGGFGGMFDLSSLNLKEPVLISGTDGVGTKLLLAFMMDKHDTIGVDCVAMCVNDVVVQGAAPLYFLDYIACGKADPERIEMIVKGIADGCEQAGCALIGGETAEMPGMYETEEYDVAGFTVGAVEKSRLITGETISAGDVVIGLASSGIHSNGYSLVRKILLEDSGMDLHEFVPELDCKHRDLGAVERAAALVEHELEVHALGDRPQRLGGLVPVLVGADRLLRRAGRQLEVEVVEPVVAQQVEHEVQRALELLGHLLLGAEDVGVVLGHAPHPGEAVHDARLLVAVHRAELEEPQRQVAVGPLPALVDQDVERAVHRLEVVVRAPVELHRREHAVGVPVEVARRLEQVRLGDVGRVHELVAGLLVALAASSPPSAGGRCRPWGGTRPGPSRSRRGTRTGRARRRACGGRASRPPRAG